MENNIVKLAPSILAADFARLGQQVAEAEQAGADRIRCHGHFVPTFRWMHRLSSQSDGVTDLQLEIHMMISDPEPFLQLLSLARLPR